jgi:MBG domain (YGX type)/Bacterial Ig-like domain (group 3)
VQQNAAGIAQYIVASTASEQAYLAADPAGVNAYLTYNAVAQSAFLAQNAAAQTAFTSGGTAGLQAYLQKNAPAVQSFIAANPAILQQYLTGSPTVLQQYLAGNFTALQAFVAQNVAADAAFLAGNPAALQSYVGANSTGLAAFLTASTASQQAFLNQNFAAVAQYVATTSIEEMFYFQNNSGANGINAYLASNTSALNLLLAQDVNAKAAYGSGGAAGQAAVLSYLQGNPSAAEMFLTANPTTLQQFITANPIALQTFLNGNSSILQGFLTSNLPVVQQYLAANPSVLQTYLSTNLTELQMYLAGNSTALQQFLAANPTPLQQYITANPAVLDAFLAANPTVLQQYITASPAVLQQFLAASPAVLQQFITGNAASLQTYLTSNPDVLQQYLASNPALLQQFLASNPALLQQYVSANPGLLQQFLNGAVLNLLRLKVNLNGTGNQASGGLLSTFNINNGLFTENITAAQLQALPQTFSAGTSLNDYRLNVNLASGNNVVVGGVLGNFTAGQGSNNQFIIEDSSFLGVPASAAVLANSASGGVFAGGVATFAPATVQAQAVNLYALNVPNPVATNLNAGKTFDVAAVDVLGHIGGTTPVTPAPADPKHQGQTLSLMQAVPDFYTFQGQAGDVMNFEVMSAALTRISHPIDSVLYVYEPDGKLIAWSDDQFEPSDSSIVDLKLQTTGTYTVEVDSYNNNTDQTLLDPNSKNYNPAEYYHAVQGDYELFMYRLAAYNATSGQDVLLDSNQSTVALTSSTVNDTAVYGQTVTFTAAISPNPTGVLAPTGTVTFYDGSKSLGQGIVSNGMATYTTTAGQLPAGLSQSITAVYSGDNNYTGNSAALTEVVGKAAPTITVADMGGTYSGNAFDATDTVAGVIANVDTTPAASLEGVTPTLTYYVGTVVVGTGSSGAPVGAGTYTVVASFAGSADYASASNQATFTIGQASSTTTATGGSFTYDGTTHTGRSDVVSGAGVVTGAAVLSYSGDQIDAGSYTVKATYAGDINHTGSSGTAIITIGQAKLTVTANNAIKVTGQANPVFTASYSGFVNGDTSASLTTAPTLSTTAITSSPVGNYPITASGAVDANYAITYVAGTLSVTQAATTGTSTTLAASAGTINYDQAVTLSATVAANSGTPTGTVDFKDATTGADLGTVSLLSGKAALTTTALPIGSQTVTATYSGSANFLSSSQSTTVTVSVTANPSIYLLNATAAGALTLSGNAQIKVSGVVFVDSNSSTVVVASGNAIVTAGAIQVDGKIQSSGNAKLSPAPVTGAASFTDPLLGLAAPTATGSINSVNLSGNSSQTIDPGIYSAINVSGNGKLTMNPGVYIIIAGGGFSVSGNGSVSGSGVTIYNAGSNVSNDSGNFGSVTLSGNGNISLTAPTTGAYAGVLIFQSRHNTKDLGQNKLVIFSYGTARWCNSIRRETPRVSG